MYTTRDHACQLPVRFVVFLVALILLHFYISVARIYYLRISLYGIGGCGLISELDFETLYAVLVAKITFIYTSLGGVPGPWTFDVTAVREIQVRAARAGQSSIHSPSRLTDYATTASSNEARSITW